ncbi:carbohydrate-binding domain-containing protein [Paenarthrobacter sp. CM16]|uniref:carbohydrate-binding domain-containing protein n=1 Tax=Paenarthrobacter sp. CM16 TaxID=2738447 RepID=UPI0015561141|nr:carbohydrate-binding domain-containing protein [Paenarthrobacter sp. CM16]NQD88288.1 carbohydrate-binding domain-containing protein [Paenarthrobacter sp. CM16]
MRSFRTSLSVAAVALAVSLAGCSTAATSSTPTGTTSSNTTTNTTQQAVTAATVEEDTHYDNDDLTWDAATEVAISLADDGSKVTSSGSTGVAVDGDTVTISAAGTYRLSGSLSDGHIVVAAGEEDTVRIILDGVELGNSNGSPFVVQSADEAIVYLEDGSTNTLTDATTYADQGDDAPNAALYSMADLTIAGTGSLTVNGKSNDGIVSKDGLVMAAGKVTVDAVDDGIRGKDYTVLLDGAYQVTAGGDGVKADNETDEGRGWLLVSGGSLTVNAGDDGVKAFNTLTVSGGTVTVAESEEGLEAQHIAISGGDVTVTANDDGVNASGGSSTSAATDAGAAGGMGGGMGGPGGMGGGEMAAGDYSVDVSGGTLTINSEGDGLDSNGSANISGGTVVVNGPTNDGNGALDVNGELVVSGGTVAAAGSAGMAVTPGTSSTQSGVQVTFDSSVSAGTPVHIVDSSGTVVATFVVTKTIASLVFSSSAITEGESYTVYTGGSADAGAGLTTGSTDGAQEQGTVTAGQYTQAQGPGGGGGRR